MFKILVMLSLGLAAIASNLSIQKGEIVAHTEVFADSQINPTTKEINTFLTMQKDILMLKCNFKRSLSTKCQQLQKSHLAM